MKILAINPKLKVYKNYIDYPYYLNLNLYLVLEKLVNWFMDIDLDVFDSFTLDWEIFNKEKDFFYFWWDFKKDNFNKDYDYIIVNFSPYLLYNEENIRIINGITSNFKNAKIIYINYYSWWFCFMNFSKEILINKWIIIDYFFDWNLEKDLLWFFWNSETLKKENNITNVYNTFDNKVKFKNYITFLKIISKNWLLDFYELDENSLPLYTSKWCIYNCTFCSSNNEKIKWYSFRDILDIENEIVFLIKEYWINKLIILDALFNKDELRTIELLNLFIKYNLKIEIPNWVRLDLLNEDIIEKLAKVTSNISISIESWNQEVNNKIIRKWIDLLKIESTIFLLRKYNFNIYSHYIIWFPGEKISDINDTLELAYKFYIDYKVFPLVQFATPIPWTILWMELDNNLINTNLFELFQTDYILNSDNFTKKGLIQLRDNFIKKIEFKKINKLIINLTYLCLNNCVFCATWDRYKISQKFEYIVWQLIINYRNWVRMLDLDWWEPTLYMDLIRVIKIAKKIWYKNITLTSCWRKFKDIPYLESILDSWIDNILISIHSSNKEVHNKITTKSDSFIETISWLDNIFASRVKYNFSFWINITLCKINEDNLEEYLHFIEKWKPDVLNIQFLTPFWNANSMEDIIYDTTKCIEIIKRNVDNLSYKIQLINIPFCNIKGLEDHAIWDIGKMERNMVFVWENPSNLYDYLANKRKRKPECNNCIHKIICDGYYF